MIHCLCGMRWYDSAGPERFAKLHFARNGFLDLIERHNIVFFEEVFDLGVFIYFIEHEPAEHESQAYIESGCHGCVAMASATFLDGTRNQS